MVSYNDSIGVLSFFLTFLLKSINTEETTEKCTESPVYWPLLVLSPHETIVSYHSGTGNDSNPEFVTVSNSVYLLCG